MKKTVRLTAVIAVVLSAACSGSHSSSIPAVAPQTAPVNNQVKITRAQPITTRAVPSVVHGMRTHSATRVRTLTPDVLIPGNMSYYGGYIARNENLAIVTWGFSAGEAGKDPYNEATAITNFVKATMNSPSGSWMYTVTQYSGLTGSPPTTQSAGFPGNVSLFADTGSSPPQGYTDAQIQGEITRMSNIIAPGSNPNGNGWQWIILTPTGIHPSWFISQYCAYHSNMSYTAYAIIPYMPDAGATCGENSVNSGTAGILDGSTIVTGHELAELTTDAVPSIQRAWQDSSGNEIGDKCAWYNLGNVTFSNGSSYAMQPLWSNNASGCVMQTTAAAACTLDAKGYCASVVSFVRGYGCDTGVTNPHGVPIIVYGRTETYDIWSASGVIETATEKVTLPPSAPCTQTITWSPANPAVTYNDPNLP